MLNFILFGSQHKVENTIFCDQMAVIRNIQNLKYSSSERRLAGCYSYFQQLLEHNLIHNFKFVQSHRNVADGLTKPGENNQLLLAHYHNMLVLSDGQEISGKRAKKQHQFILKQAIDNQLGTYDGKQHPGADKIF